MEQKSILVSIIEEYEQIQNLIRDMDHGVFFHSNGAGSWSIAEHVHHLSLSLFPVNQSLKEPATLLKTWGVSQNAPMNYQQFIKAYHTAKQGLSWKAFPPFIPKKESENADFIKLHTTKSKDHLDHFYQLTGHQIDSLRDHFLIQENASVEAIREFFTLQYQEFMSLTTGINAEVWAYHIPLPYIGLVTLQEMTYFIYHHTQSHRMTIERLLKSSISRTS